MFIFSFLNFSEDVGGIDTLSEAGDEHGGFAIVINGHSLVFALNPKFEELFLEVASQCKFLRPIDSFQFF